MCELYFIVHNEWNHSNIIDHLVHKNSKITQLTIIVCWGGLFFSHFHQTQYVHQIHIFLCLHHCALIPTEFSSGKAKIFSKFTSTFLFSFCLVVDKSKESENLSSIRVWFWFAIFLKWLIEILQFLVLDLVV